LFTSSINNPGTSTTYQWFKNGNIISGATADTFSTTTLQSGDTISLQIQTNAECIVSSNSDESNTIQAVCALPIKLISFKGEKKSDLNCFNWESTGEETGSYYEIQGSSMGTNWETLSTIPSRFIGKSKASYQTCIIQNSHEFFRLSWVDANGSRSYGPVVFLSKGEKTWSIAPNPAKQTIQIMGLKGSANVQLTNLEGKTILKGTTQNQPLFWESLPPGMYFLQINQGNHTETHKLIIAE
jgi:YD repeat-containing protein